MVEEMRAAPEGTIEIGLDQSLERDLGFDSLGRVELLRRLEREFGVSLPEGALASVETPRDLLVAVEGGSAERAGRPGPEFRVAAAARSQGTPVGARTIVEALEWHVAEHPERIHIHLYGEDERVEEIRYGELHRDALAVSGGMARRGVEPGGTVGIVLPTGRDYFRAFYGALVAGAVPVPLYPPVRLTRIEEHLRRQAGVLTNAGVTVLVTFAQAKPLARALQSKVKTLRHVVTVEDLLAGGAPPARATVREGDIAFLQYTSGSTGNPKGVVLTHANLLANIRAMVRASGVTSDDVFASWLPLYHDMGLIGACLATMYQAMPVALMSPFSFLSRPERWLWAIHRHRAAVSAAPNFAYELAVAKTDDAALEGLDLSSWRIALNGAEAVSPRTIERFTRRFAPFGFRPEAMAPVYGLAECSVGLAFPRPFGTLPKIDRVRRETFARSGRAEPAEGADTSAFSFVSCGQPIPGHEIRIVDETGREVAERHEGRLQFRGPSATSGYFRNEEETRRLFAGDWLDSGDLAYVAGGDVHVTGRMKDLVIRAGRNLYPHEIEEAVGEVEGVRKGCVAVFGSADPGSGTERLVVVAETRLSDERARESLKKRIQTAVLDVAGTPPDDIALAPPRFVPKTGSGKVRRSSARDLYEKGRIEVREKPVWAQRLRLVAAALAGSARARARVAGEYLYAAWVGLVFLLLALAGWIAVALLPRRAWRWAAVRAASRAVLFLARIPVRVEGRERLPAGPFVLVSNHTSYADVLVLSAVLPRGPSYVAKREFLGSALARIPLARLGALFVERFDAEQGVEDAKHVSDAVAAGATLAVFPEGTFQRRPGLLPFRTGAFAIAAERRLPVVPVALRGTRSVLVDSQWFPRWGEVAVTIGEPIPPDGADWSAAIRLRDRAREVILAGCGEPDLERETVAV
ncbi:MAG: AMP-binding protein [Planctomycetes bacterium]|nr:AMP-binding protein [Planctomycetota bacterium]